MWGLKSSGRNMLPVALVCSWDLASGGQSGPGVLREEHLLIHMRRSGILQGLEGKSP